MAAKRISRTIRKNGVRVTATVVVRTK